MAVFTREDLLQLGYRFGDEVDYKFVDGVVADITCSVIECASNSKLSYTWVSENPLRPLVRNQILQKLGDKFPGCDVIGLGNNAIYINWSPKQK